MSTWRSRGRNRHIAWYTSLYPWYCSVRWMLGWCASRTRCRWCRLRPANISWLSCGILCFKSTLCAVCRLAKISDHVWEKAAH